MDDVERTPPRKKWYKKMKDTMNWNTINTLFERIDERKQGIDNRRSQWYTTKEGPGLQIQTNKSPSLENHQPPAREPSVSPQKTGAPMSDCFNPPVNHWKKLDHLAKIFSPRTTTLDPHAGEIIS